MRIVDPRLRSRDDQSSALECEIGVDGCDVLSDSERTCCLCVFVAEELELTLEATIRIVPKCASRIYQSED